MSASSRRLLTFLALALCATSALAVQDPNSERGVRPGLSYRLEGIDNVNLFNGTINLTLPLGISYPVGGTLSYSFAAHYATNAWDSAQHEVETEYETPSGPRTHTTTYTYWYPSEHANAGFGWIVSLGRLDLTPEELQDTWSYVSPDGNEHKFESTLHPQEQSQSGVLYTRDGTYLRLKSVGSQYKLEFPNGNFHWFNLQGLLTRMEDQFGNYVDVTYPLQGPGDPYPGSTVWVLTDSHGRQQRVYFRPGWDYFEELWEDEDTPQVKSHQMVTRVELTAFGGQTATYAFHYAVPPQAITSGNENDPSLKTSRRCNAGVQDPYVPQFVRVSLLSSVNMPEGVTYSMVTDRGDHETCSFTGLSGHITKLTLPTAGTIEWTYQPYQLPAVRGTSSTRNIGVATRTTRLSAGGPAVGVTTYDLGKVDYGQYARDLYRVVTNKDGDSTVINATKHYFAACPHDFCGYPGDYGLPYSREADFLSTEIQVPNSSGVLTTKRKTFVQYEADTLLSLAANWAHGNQRPFYQRTEYEDGTFAAVTHSEFDGLGHYRKSVTDGDFEKGNTRTSFTGYNPNAGVYALNPDGSLQFSYSLPSSSADWILTTFDKQWTSVPKEPGPNEPEPAPGEQVPDVYSRTSYCFNADGFMTSRRTLAGLSFSSTFTTSSQDLLAVFTPDGDGNLMKEQYFGGDVTPVPSYTCSTASLTNEAYRIDHAYEYGVEKTSYYVENGQPMSFYLTDNLIDPTGLVSDSRRFRGIGLSDGLTTSYTYDLLGRQKETTGVLLKTTHAYTVQPPKITVTDKTLSGTTLRTSTVELDALGRQVKETRSMPSSVTATRTTAYNGLGWKTSMTDWGASAPTLFGYDGFGRPATIQAPDQAPADAATVAYTGVSQVTRATKVRTGGTGASMTLTTALTTEDYDRQGRLIRVTEPPPSVGGTRPKTEYRYDVGNRLRKVCSNIDAALVCGQTRWFTYDNRGFLTQEIQPESGTTTYVKYDARGHLLRKYTGAPYQFDVELTFDRAERLKQIDEKLSSDTRPLKMFFYADANAGTDKKNGRLFEAVRHNWFSIPASTPIPFNVQVIETYAYADPEGNVSSRQTRDYPCQLTTTPSQNCKSLRPVAEGHSFTQQFTYDELDATKTVTYPQCTFTGGCQLIGNRTVTNTYSNGMLTGVSSANTASATLTYHSSGMVNAVAHGNGVTDTHVIDPLTPGRPKEIITTGATEVSACVVPSFSVQPQSVTITGGTSTTLTATATGQSGQAIAYQWYRATAPTELNPISSGANLSPTVTTNYWVKATNSCGSTASVTATVTVCDPAHVTAGQANLTMTRGETRTLQITAAGSQPVSYQWFTVAGGIETAIPGATSASHNISPTQTTLYRVKASNSCGNASDDVTVTVVAPPTVPGSVTASYSQSQAKNIISWTASSSSVSISHYLVRRQPGNSTFTVNAPTVTYSDQTALVPGKAYVYRVAAVDSNGIASADSAPDLAAVRTFTSDPLPVLPEIRGVFVSELRSAVDAVRFAAGLPPAWSSYAPATGLIAAADFTMLRDKLNEARSVLQMAPVAFSSPVEPGFLMPGTAITELRGGVK